MLCLSVFSFIQFYLISLLVCLSNAFNLITRLLCSSSILGIVHEEESISIISFLVKDVCVPEDLFLSSQKFTTKGLSVFVAFITTMHTLILTLSKTLFFLLSLSGKESIIKGWFSQITALRKLYACKSPKNEFWKIYEIMPFGLVRYLTANAKNSL